MRKQLLISAGALAITVAMTGPLTAADYPVKAPPAAAASVFNWSGFYIGGNLGYGSSGFASPTSQPELGTRRGKGLVGGLQAGYNIQNGNIVWGIEGDISATGLSTHLSDNSYTTDLLASIRGRLGLAFDRVLVYGTGGFGYVRGKVFTSGAVSGNNQVTYNKNKPVWGGGIEWAATNNLTYRIEALDFVGTKGTCSASTASCPLDEVNVIKNTWEVRFGLNYKFDGSGWGKGPVYAKY